jgi:hypothetical protein
MTPDQFATALAEFAPDDTKVIMSSTTDTVVFSAIPRSKDSDSLPERHFPLGKLELISLENDDPSMVPAGLATLFPERMAEMERASKEAMDIAERQFNKKQAELTAAEERSKERVAEKIQLGRKPKGK